MAQTQKITMKSSLREVYAHPVGHDALKKILLQLGLGDFLLTNPVTGSLSLRAASKLCGKFLDAAFWDTFLKLLNSEKDMPEEEPLGGIQKVWWKEAVFYQIYPRSFADSNGDGIGDLKGILGKLDYLKNLGVDALWLSPVYDSPNDDNGYDIRDYHKIMEEFGTMEDFDRLLYAVHERGMRLIMDLVVNHTSDEHPWFQKAVDSPDSPYHDYYLFAKNENGQAPNNWVSFFGQGKPGDAWKLFPENDEWALHLFSEKQMDLNWDNREVRAEIAAMVNWWLEKGVDGFRMDVINYISKTEGLPDGNESIGNLIGYTGIEHYFYGPHLHEYLRELRAESFGKFDAFSVGETPGIGMQMAKLLTDGTRRELDMVFSFDHLETPGHTRFDDYRYDLNFLKNYYIEWTRDYAKRCWMSLFFENHDNPRMISKIDPDPRFRASIGKLLAMIQMTLRGTPFIYQGQEIGAVNADFQNISELSDVESLNLYEEFCETMGEDAAFRKILAGTRDHARVMMDWEETRAQERDRDSVYHFYKKLIRIRKKHPALVYGDVEFLHVNRKNLFAWTRTLDGDSWYVECNLCSRRIRRPRRPDGFRGVLAGSKRARRLWMQPYEVCLYRRAVTGG